MDRIELCWTLVCVCLSVSLCFVIYPVYCLVSFSSNFILWSIVFVSIGLDMSEVGDVPATISWMRG